MNQLKEYKCNKEQVTLSDKPEPFRKRGDYVQAALMYRKKHYTRIFYFLTIFVVRHSFSWQIANIYAIQIQFEFMHRLFRQKHSYQIETEACSKNEGKTKYS